MKALSSGQKTMKGFSKLPAFALLLVVGLGQVAKGEPRMNDSNAVKVRLSVKVEKHHPIAFLTYTNQSNKPVYVERGRGGLSEDLASLADRESMNVFEITSNGKPVPYKGIMVKRAPHRVEECVALSPGKSIEGKIVLSKYYEFFSGRHTYRLKYECYHDQPNNKGALVQLSSNEVEFSI